LGKNVGKRAAIVKPGNFLLARQLPAGLPQPAESGAFLAQAGAQFPIQSSRAAEQIRCPGEVQVACNNNSTLFLSLGKGNAKGSYFELTQLANPAPLLKSGGADYLFPNPGDLGYQCRVLA